MRCPDVLVYTIRRLLVTIPLLIVSSFIVFVMEASTGNPLDAYVGHNPPYSAAFLHAEKIRLHLDQPMVERYVNWLIGILHGDWGPSVVDRHGVIRQELFQRLGVTVRLIFVAMVLAVVLAIIVGVISAVKQYSFLDYSFTFTGFLFLSLPVFWFAILLKEGGIWLNTNVFGQRVFDTIGEASIPPPHGFGSVLLDDFGHLVLPTIVLAMTSYAAWSRFQRGSMLEVLGSDYIRLARAKGLSRRRVMVRHALRTALIPLTTVTALDIASILGGAVITETIFQWHGMGEYLLSGIRNHDVYPVAGWLLVSAAFVILFNLLADLLYAVLDPRIRYE
jgi:peptide/nickel transport system permease protein